MPEPTSVGRARFTVEGNRWDLSPAGADSGSTPISAEVTVVIPFYDNQDDLDLLLTALAVQTHPRTRLQTIIADDGSPQPPHIPESARDLDITIVRQDDAGFRAGAARNLGVRHADGQVILFLDGDTVPTPRYVERLGRWPAILSEAMVSGRRRYSDLTGWTPADLLAWFAGQVAPPRQWDEPAWMTDEYLRTENLLNIHPRSYKYLIGAVLGCSREMFDEIGGFDETITGYGGEDYDFTFRAHNSGSILAYVPDAVAWHDGPDWAGRTDPARQTQDKNREVMMLAERIPEPSMRGRGQLYPVVDVVVTVFPDGWSLGAGVLCVRSMLGALDAGVWIDGTHQSTEALRTCFRGDPRVRSRPLEEIADQHIAARARLRLDVRAPLVATPRFRDSLLSMLENDWGTITITVAGRVVAAAESTRSRFRRRRFPPPDPHADRSWFAHRVMDAQDAGIHLIHTEPRLAAVFGEYGDQDEYLER